MYRYGKNLKKISLRISCSLSFQRLAIEGSCFLPANMNEQSKRLQELLQRYLANTCTRQELDELLAAVAQEPADSWLLQVMEQHWHNSASAAGMPDAEARLENLLQSTRPATGPADQPFTGTVIKERRNTHWQRYAAAAALLTGIAVGTYFYLQPAPDRAGKLAGNNTLQQTNVTPGSNKALLTLADGTTVTLDSAGNQVLQQGNTAIHQHKGHLQYAVQGTTSTVSFNTLSTPRGGQYQVVLPDGTKVWLNAASRLKYPTAFTGKERVVELQGQAYFEIAQKAEQPFKVRLDNMEVQVLGTSFDIMAYPDENTVNTTLLTGAVKVLVNKESRLLQPGQQASVATSGHIGIATVNVDDVLAWKEGYFAFRDAGLETIMRQLSRWYDVDVRFEGPIPQGTFSGEIGKSLSLAQTLKILEQTRVHFKIEDNKRIVILP